MKLSLLKILFNLFLFLNYSFVGCAQQIPSKEKNARTSKYQFRQHHNKPTELWSEKLIKQKIDYIHNNPVVSGFVTDSMDWKYSSARNYQDDNTVLEIYSVGF